VEKLLKISVILYMIMSITACQKNSVHPPPNNSKLTISNLTYAPDTVIIIGTGSSTFNFQGSINFLNAEGGVAAFRLTTSTGSDLTVAVPSNAQTNGSLMGVFEVAFPAAVVGNYTFQLWIIDRGGNVSNKLQGTVRAVIDDGGRTWVNTNFVEKFYRVIWANQRFILVGDYLMLMSTVSICLLIASMQICAGRQRSINIVP